MGVRRRASDPWRQRLAGGLMLLQLAALCLYFLASQPGPEESQSLRVAYATMLCDDSMLEACSVLLHSVRQTGTAKTLIVLTSSHVSDSSREMLSLLGATIQPIPEDDDDEIEGLSSHGCEFSKLLLWNLTQYDKVIYLDSDMLVLRPLDHLFGRHVVLAAVPDHMPPDRFNSGLLLLQPNAEVYSDMLSRLNATRVARGSEQDFLNEYFHGWYQQSPDHHLPYGYNAHVRMAGERTWPTWVGPQLYVLHFSNAAKPWNMRIEDGHHAERRFDRFWWAAMYSMHETLAKQGHSMVQLSPQCRSDFMAYGRSPALNDLKKQKLSVLLMALKAPTELVASLVKQYAAMQVVHAIYVVRTATHGGLEAEVELDVGLDNSVLQKTIEVIHVPEANPSERWKPLRSLETEAILVCSPEMEVSEAVLEEAHRRWLDGPSRLVGFFPRAHYRTGDKGPLTYVNRPQGEYSMVLLQMALLHADYLRAFTCQSPPGLLKAIENQRECIDVALNYMVSHLSGQPPLLVLDPTKASLDGSGEPNGTHCLEAMDAIFGFTPLKNTSESAGVFQSLHSTLEGIEAHQAGLQTDWAPIFDFEGEVSHHLDENLKFMPRVGVSLRSPELSLVPFKAPSGSVLLCVWGNDTSRDQKARNQYALVSREGIPPNALRLNGTTFIAMSRHGFDDHPLMLEALFGSFFHFSQSYESENFTAQRLLLFRKGGVVSAMAKASLQFTQALLGSHMKPMELPDASTPVCFDRVAVVRRHRGDLADHPTVLAQMREKIWKFCAGGRQPNGTRVTILEDSRPAGKGRLLNPSELARHLRSACGVKCHTHRVALSVKGSFCHLVRSVKTASVVVAPHGEALASSTLFMTPGTVVVELAAPDNSTPGRTAVFKDCVADKDCMALGLHLKSLVMSQASPSKSPPGFAVFANVAAVAKAVLQVVDEIAHMGTGRTHLEPLRVASLNQKISPKSSPELVNNNGESREGRTENDLATMNLSATLSIVKRRDAKKLLMDKEAGVEGTKSGTGKLQQVQSDPRIAQSSGVYWRRELKSLDGEQGDNGEGQKDSFPEESQGNNNRQPGHLQLMRNTPRTIKPITKATHNRRNRTDGSDEIVA